jgi:type VI protein secretion system component VasF
MARDIYADIDRLADQLADLRSSLVKQARYTADDATSYLAPRAREVAMQLQREGYHIAEAARRNPGTATGAAVGALALGALAWFLLSGTSREED